VTSIQSALAGAVLEVIVREGSKESLKATNIQVPEARACSGLVT
jgi:hypothetical protein